MSLVPLLFSDWWEDLDHPHHLLDQNFGVDLNPEELLTPAGLQLLHHKRAPLMYNHRPWNHSLLHKKSGTSIIVPDKDQFQVVLDVQQFLPDEIDVKVVDNYIVVTAKHEERRDEHGYVSRQFTRKYLVPEQCDIEQVASKLSSDGVLTICVPRKKQTTGENERVIKIEHTGKPAIQGKTTKPIKQKPVQKEKEKWHQ